MKSTPLSKNIQIIRKENNETLEEFGKRFDPIAHKSLVSKWEKGLSKPNNKRLKEIAKLANISVDQLIYGDLLIFLNDNLNLKNVEQYFNNLDGLVRQNIIDMIYNVNNFQYADIFDTNNYKKILELCQNTLEYEVLFFIDEGKKTVNSFNDKDITTLKFNDNILLVSKYLNNIPINNEDYIKDYRFIVDYISKKYKFDNELINRHDPLFEIYNLLYAYFNSIGDKKELIEKAIALIEKLEGQGYENSRIGNALIKFLENDYIETLTDEL